MFRRAALSTSLFLRDSSATGEFLPTEDGEYTRRRKLLQNQICTVFISFAYWGEKLDLHVSSFFLGNVTVLGVLCCFALFVCSTLLASFFLPSHLSLKHVFPCLSPTAQDWEQDDDRANGHRHFIGRH